MRTNLDEEEKESKHSLEDSSLNSDSEPDTDTETQYEAFEVDY